MCWCSSNGCSTFANKFSFHLHICVWCAVCVCGYSCAFPLLSSLAHLTPSVRVWMTWAHWPPPPSPPLLPLSTSSLTFTTNHTCSIYTNSVSNTGTQHHTRGLFVNLCACSLICIEPHIINRWHETIKCFILFWRNFSLALLLPIISHAYAHIWTNGHEKNQNDKWENELEHWMNTRKWMHGETKFGGVFLCFGAESLHMHRKVYFKSIYLRQGLNQIRTNWNGEKRGHPIKAGMPYKHGLNEIAYWFVFNLNLFFRFRFIYFVRLINRFVFQLQS